MRIIHQESSTNGRWGLTIVCEQDVSLTEAPVEGEMVRFKEKVEGKELFKFTPRKSGKWWMLLGDVEPLSGCKVAYGVSLQSNNYASIVVGGEFFALTSYGYKRRSSRILAFQKGERVELPSAVLVAMGVIKVEEEKVEDEPPSPSQEVMNTLRKEEIL